MSRKQRNNPLQILLVEDNPADAMLLRMALESTRIKYELHHVEDGKEALDFVLQQGEFKEATRPSVILLDLNLPRVDGRKVLKQLKDHPDLRAIPVLVLTSSDAPSDVEYAYNALCNAYVCKPLGFQPLLEVAKAIETWLRTTVLPGDLTPGQTGNST